MNHVSAETLFTWRMKPSGTNSKFPQQMYRSSDCNKYVYI